MKYEEAKILSEEGGTVVIDGKKMYNATKARNHELQQISDEIKKIQNSNKDEKLKQHMLSALHKRKIQILSGKDNEYTTGGNIINKKEYKIDSFNVKNSFGLGNDLESVKNWSKARGIERKISEKLNKQNTKKTFKSRQE